MKKEMTSLERVYTSLGRQEPDRLPFFLLTTMHGAKELGLSIKEYFSRAENLVEGQLRLRAKYRSDCIYAFFYASLEIEAWGGGTVFWEDGPPNADAPVIRRIDDILGLEPPRVADSPALLKVLDATQRLKAAVGDDAPIIGVAISPFSLPTMQLGFDRYIELMYERPDLTTRLLNINQEFCVEWANAQLSAGATAICYFDPVSSTSIVPRDLFLKYGFPVAKNVIGRLKGAVAMHFASGRCMPILNDIIQTGAVAVAVSAAEDLAELKSACKGKMSLIGNLNAIEMRRWDSYKAEAEVKKCIAAAGRGGGYILSDHHGEIPFDVPDDILLAISEAVHKWGRYPLNWLESDDNG